MVACDFMKDQSYIINLQIYLDFKFCDDTNSLVFSDDIIPDQVIENLKSCNHLIKGNISRNTWGMYQPQTDRLLLNFGNSCWVKLLSKS